MSSVGKLNRWKIVGNQGLFARQLESDMEKPKPIAEKQAEGLWREGSRCAVVEATPMRPGRGRKASHPQRRRLETRRAILEFEEKVGSVFEGLRSGTLSLEDAQQEIREAGFEPFVRIALSRDELEEGIATFHGLGYYLWDVTESDGILRIRFSTRRQLT